MNSGRNGKNIWSTEKTFNRKHRENGGDRHWNSPRKIKMHEKMQFIACNVRGINTLGKIICRAMGER